MTKRQAIDEACDEVSNGRIRVWRGMSGSIYFKAPPHWNWCVLIPAGQPIPGKTVAEVREFLETEIAIRLLGGK